MSCEPERSHLTGAPPGRKRGLERAGHPGRRNTTWIASRFHEAMRARMAITQRACVASWISLGCVMRSATLMGVGGGGWCPERRRPMAGRPALPVPSTRRGDSQGGVDVRASSPGGVKRRRVRPTVTRPEARLSGRWGNLSRRRYQMESGNEVTGVRLPVSGQCPSECNAALRHIAPWHMG